LTGVGEKLAKQESRQKETQKQCEKNKIINLYIQDHSNRWIHFHKKNYQSKLSNDVQLPYKHCHALDSQYQRPHKDTHVSQ
jgi:hypothetical protein